MAWSKSEPPRSGSHWSSRASDVSTWPFSVQTLQTREHPCEGIKAPQVAREEQLTLVNLGASVALDRQGIQSIKQWTGERGWDHWSCLCHKTVHHTGGQCDTTCSNFHLYNIFNFLFYFYQYDTTCQRFSSVRYAVSVVFTCTILFTVFYQYDTRFERFLPVRYLPLFCFLFLPVRYNISVLFTSTTPFTVFLPVQYDISVVFTSTTPFTVFFTSTIRHFRFSLVKYGVSVVFICTIHFSSFHLYDTIFQCFFVFFPPQYDTFHCFYQYDTTF